MYDARERAIRDRKWEIDSLTREAEIKGEVKGKLEGKPEGEIKGRIEGKIETIRILQGLLYLQLSSEQELRDMTLTQLDAMANDLQERLRNRAPS